MSLAVIDYDIFLYEIGYAGQQSIWEVDGRYYETRREAKVTSLGKEPIEHIEASPWHIVRKMLDNRINGILRATKAGEYEGYLTGKGNYRESVATILKYKGNRSGQKPHHYEAIRDYLIQYHGASIVSGIEADDAISIRGLETGGVICSRDKDLRQVPGLHYSWEVANQPEKPVYKISEVDGMRSLAKQSLTGDTIDNIYGVPTIGDKKADALLDGLTSEKELWEAVERTYARIFGENPIFYHSWDGKRMWANWWDVLAENHALLYMLRTRKDAEMRGVKL